MNHTISLNGAWTLRFCPEDGRQPCSPQMLASSTIPTIEAVVPGNVELDLMRAGLEPDPFYGDHIYRFRKYEFYTWWYEREFEVPDGFAVQNAVLRFDGLDTYASVFLNGAQIGSAENGLVEHAFLCAQHLRAGVNRLQVHISSAVNRARRADYPVALRVSESVGDELLTVRKAPHCFGWDIAPRLLSAGLWRDVTLQSLPQTRLCEVYLATRSANATSATLELRYRFETEDCFLEDFTVCVSGACKDSSFRQESRALFVAGKLTFTVPQPQLWWPRGYGNANLYHVTVELRQRGVVLDRITLEIGIRTAYIERTYPREDAGSFLVRVNDIPIMIKGTNWVPLDCLHSRDAERLETAHALLCDVGCNMVRCWGGNVYESDRFYELCDREGVLVWQDFAMACGIYDQGEDFAAQIAEEARKVAIRLRNHASLLTWAGDNEVDQFYSNTGYLLPHARYNRITREVLPRVLAMHDPYREYIPSSPYLPEGNTEEYTVPEQHNWGPRDYFKGDFYKNTTAHFISEIGYHGCPSLDSLRAFLPEEQVLDFGGASAMRTHNTDYALADPRGYDRNELMRDQVKTMFGIVPESPEDFVLASQISQAEAKKYFIESTRLKKWRRSGIVWWNLLDGWPQISDAVVDYYFRKKLAYSYIKRVQQPICIMMDEANAWQHRLVLCNDSLEETQVAYVVTCAESEAVLAQGECISKANENIELPPIPCIPGEKKLNLIHWTYGKKQGSNHYVSGFVPYDFAQYKLWLVQMEKILKI